MKTQSENKTMQQWYFCSVSLKKCEGKKGDAKNSRSTHTPTQTRPSHPKGSLFTGFWKRAERAAFIQRFGGN